MADRDQRFSVPRPGDDVQSNGKVKGLKGDQTYEVVYTGRRKVVLLGEDGLVTVDHNDFVAPLPLAAHPVGVGPNPHETEGRDPAVQPELADGPSDRDKGK